MPLLETTELVTVSWFEPPLMQDAAAGVAERVAVCVDGELPEGSVPMKSPESVSLLTPDSTTPLPPLVAETVLPVT